MASIATLQAIGNWKKDVAVPLSTLYAVSLDLIGQDGEATCRQAIRFGAASASKLTESAPKNRPVEHDFTAGRDLPFVTVYHKSRQPSRVYKFQFAPKNRAESGIGGTWESWREIKNRGLAKRSWFWSLSKFGLRADRGPIKGASALITIRKPNVNGYIKQVKLAYIQKPGVMPAGWEPRVQALVANRIMGTARNRLMTKWRRATGAVKGAKIPNEDLARFFMPGEST